MSSPSLPAVHTTSILYLYLKSPLHLSITHLPLAIFNILLLSIPTTTATTTNQQQQRPHQITRQNYYYPLLPLPSVDCQYINRHNSHIKTNADRKITLLRHSVSVCYHHWVKHQIEVKMLILLSRWLLPCQNDCIYNCLQNSHHYLTFSYPLPAYTYINHTTDDPPKNITLNNVIYT